jgi:transcriptional regulator with XRE-family HTH domain
MTARSAFGTELRRRRQLAGVSLTQLAAMTHYSKGYLSKVECGGKNANPSLAILCDAALGANGALVALVGPARRPPDEPDEPDPVLGDGLWDLRLSPDGGGYLARGDGALDVGSRFGPSFGADRLAGDPAAVLALYADRFTQERSLGQLLSPALVLPALITETHLLIGLADRAQDGTGAGLWRMAAQFAEYVGWMVQETGDDRQALWWTAFAVRLAEKGGDLSLRPYAYFRQSDITLHADDPLGTIGLARQAQEHPEATVRVRGLAVQREAHGHAMLGDREACMRALDRSAELLDEASRVATGTPVLGVHAVPDPTAMARGWCLVDLGRPADAAAVLEDGLAGFEAGATRARARYGVRTALAQVIADEVERACEILEWLADDLRQIDSATVRHDVRLLNREFRRHPNQPRVRDLLPVLADLLRGPAARDT